MRECFDARCDSVSVTPIDGFLYVLMGVPHTSTVALTIWTVTNVVGDPSSFSHQKEIVDKL